MLQKGLRGALSKWVLSPAKTVCVLAVTGEHPVHFVKVVRTLMNAYLTAQSLIQFLKGSWLSK